MKRIMILGFSGGGKSTLAQNMGKILGIEPTHMDALHWLPNWVESSREEKIEKLTPVLQREAWIIDGNYQKILWTERVALADTVIFIDVNRFTCFWQAWRRSKMYKGKTRPDMGEGCTEKFDWEFAKWVFFLGRKKRKDYLRVIHEFAAVGKSTYILRTKKDINNFLKGLKQYEGTNELVQ